MQLAAQFFNQYEVKARSIPMELYGVLSHQIAICTRNSYFDVLSRFSEPVARPHIPHERRSRIEEEVHKAANELGHPDVSAEFVHNTKGIYSRVEVTAGEVLFTVSPASVSSAIRWARHRADLSMRYAPAWFGEEKDINPDGLQYAVLLYKVDREDPSLVKSIKLVFPYPQSLDDAYIFDVDELLAKQGTPIYEVAKTIEPGKPNFKIRQLPQVEKSG